MVRRGEGIGEGWRFLTGQWGELKTRGRLGRWSMIVWRWVELSMDDLGAAGPPRPLIWFLSF